MHAPRRARIALRSGAEAGGLRAASTGTTSSARSRVYGDAVQQRAYRDAKVRTLLVTAVRVLGPSARTTDLEVVDDAGRAHRDPAVVLVSNNPSPLRLTIRPRALRVLVPRP